MRSRFALAASRYKFERRGQSGSYVSDLLPHIASNRRRHRVVNSVKTENFNHALAKVFAHTSTSSS